MSCATAPHSLVLIFVGALPVRSLVRLQELLCGKRPSDPPPPRPNREGGKPADSVWSLVAPPLSVRYWALLWVAHSNKPC